MLNRKDYRLYWINVKLNSHPCIKCDLYNSVNTKCKARYDVVAFKCIDLNGKEINHAVFKRIKKASHV